MASISNNHDPQALSLPQYGFGTDIDFRSLIRTNHFLFRVYTPPKAPSSRLNDDDDPYFLAPRFNQKYDSSPLDFPPWKSTPHSDSDPHASIGTYDDVARHMDWTTRSSSAYISTSFSFIWSIWEALRRYYSGVKKDVEIAVIDARALSDRAVTAVQLLRTDLPSERRREHWKWYRFAQESQSVLVYGYIPSSAVLASIPLIPLLERLPSYFLRPALFDPTNKSNPLASVGWNYTEKKQNFRRFCRDMSKRFLQLSSEARLQDSTTGSVRLAISFLRPWFHRQIIEDFERAIAALCALSFSIAQWPGQWWAQEHPEMWDLIRAMVLSLAEEIRTSQRGRKPDVDVKVQTVVDRESSDEDENEGMNAGPRSSPALAPLAMPATVEPVFHSPVIKVPPSGLSRSYSQRTYTPITPPVSPIRPFTNAWPTGDSGSRASSATAINMTASSPELDALQLLPEPVIGESSALDQSVDELLPPPQEPAPPIVDGLPLPAPVVESHSLDKLPLEEDRRMQYGDTDAISRAAPAETRPSAREQRKVFRRSPSVLETASCVATGFLIGAFITLCVVSPTRRTLLTHLT